MAWIELFKVAASHFPSRVLAVVLTLVAFAAVHPLLAWRDSFIAKHELEAAKFRIEKREVNEADRCVRLQVAQRGGLTRPVEITK